MPFIRQQYIGEISDKLSQLQRELINRNGLRMYDSNFIAEDFFCGFLNILYGWNLINANEAKRNCPGIDLIDEDNLIVVQVSSKKDSDKIQTSIDKFLENFKPEEEYQFYMLVITEKQTRYGIEFVTKQMVKLDDGTSKEVEVAFDKKTDIWDASDLLQQVKKRETTIQKLEELYEYLEQELGDIKNKRIAWISEKNGMDSQVDSGLPEYKNANQQYAAGFVRPLFLHDGNSKVNLEKLFVWQDYSEENEKEHLTLKERIGRFAADGSEKLLLIEGDAGTGKSTLVQCMNYYYANLKKIEEKNTDGKENIMENDRECASSLFGGRELVTVRLRDFTKEMRTEAAKENQLLNILAQYLKQSVSEMKASFGSILYVLDGFDELCTSDSGIDSNEMVEILRRSLPVSARMIITSRPNYVQSLRGEGIRRIILKHYSQEQREEWVSKYTEKCEQELPGYLKEYIKKIGKKNSIFDVPLNLYMLAAKKPDQDKLQNTWNLYRDILYRDIRDTEASKQTEREDKFTDSEHPEAGHWDVYYRICEEIAYEMYATGNKKLWVNTEDIRKIIRRLRVEKTAGLPEIFFENLEKHCHALCGFWKTDIRSGIFEFYHNDIRDFFLCEKVFWELNRIYRDSQIMTAEKAEEDARKMAELFQYGRLEKKVLIFLNERAGMKFRKEGEALADFAVEEYGLPLNEKCFPRIVQVLLTNWQVYTSSLINTEKSCIACWASTAKCILEVLAVVNYTFLQKGEYTSLWTNVEEINKNGILQHFFQEEDSRVWLLGTNLNDVQMEHAFLRDADLRKCSMNRADLSYALLQNADLQKCVLEEADLTGAMLEDAKLADANLKKACLAQANLAFAKMSGVDIKDTLFEGAKLYGVESGVIQEIRQAETFTWADFTGSDPQNWKNEMIPGGLIEFGSYWQGKTKKEGKTPILWRILDVDQKQGRALLLADQILDNVPYHIGKGVVNWENCSLREWLNGSDKLWKSSNNSFLYQAFEENERKRICTVKILPDDTLHMEENNKQTNGIRDQVFLLSKEEVIRYFGRGMIDENEWIYINMHGKQAAATATKYAKNVNDSRLSVNDNLGTSWWWLRSVGVSGLFAMNVDNDGDVDTDGRIVNSDKVGVRPALWLNLKS